MSSSTFLSDIAEHEPVIVLEDRVYTLSNFASDRLLYADINGVKKGLSEGEMFIELENWFMQDSFDKEIARARKRVESKREISAKKRSELETKVGQNNIERFIDDFIMTWSHRDEAILKLRSVPTEIDDSDIGIGKGMTYHEPNERKSVMSHILGETGLLIIDNLVYELIKFYPSEVNKTFIYNGDELLGLKYRCSLEEFDQLYMQKLNGFLAEGVKFLESAEMQKLDSIIKKCDSAADAARTPYENFSGEIGWMKDSSGHYYLYINKPDFEIYSPARGMYFLFPQCQLGVRIKGSGSSLTYETTVKVLKAKEPKNGKSIGLLKSMKDKDYKHPATKYHMGDYPHICVGSYSLPSSSGVKALKKTVRGVLVDVHQLFQEGYFDSTAVSSVGGRLWRYLDTDQETFKDNEVHR